MARTHEYAVRLETKEDQTSRMIGEQKQGATSSTFELRQVIRLSSNTANYQVSFGSNFSTPTRMLLIEHGGRSFTFSVNATNRHVPVQASGCAFLHSTGITSLRLSNSSTNTTKPEVEIILVR